ncbi:Hypothetical predicted protein [Mytilus galloprovincialis]|uniref:Uncharacterized protein n=1 Tax=Mytilus galloprovincialis TaxID=29158 RepID=A0A8B6GLI9_MYTGA|nr:Hypothetical predicted protein [Mytilus galloprovincialis]
MKNPEDEEGEPTDVGDNTGCGDSTTSTATNSSGIGSGMSIKSSEDNLSVSSGGTVQSTVRILHLCQRGEWAMAEQLLRTTERGHPDLSQPDEETGVTPLMIVVRENKLVLAERLLDLGAGVNDRAKDGRTCLHYAASFAKDDIVKLLLNRKADCNLPGGPKDQLPLHMASARNTGAVTVVQYLLKSAGKETRLVTDKRHERKWGNAPRFCREQLPIAGHPATIRPDAYSGSDDWEEYFSHFQDCAELGRWSMEDRVLTLAASLKGPARTFYMSLPTHERRPYSILVRRLEERFGSARQQNRWLSRFEMRTRNSGETVAALGDDLRQMVQKAYCNLDSLAQEVLALNQLYKSIPIEMKCRCVDRECKTVADAV